MLQDNITEHACADPACEVHAAGQKAHLAHAAVVGMHALCCGLPIVAMGAAALSGAASLALLSQGAQRIHHVLHAYESWVLALSAALVLGGGALEMSARRRAQRPALGFPWLYGLSVLCLFLNAAIIIAHRLA